MMTFPTCETFRLPARDLRPGMIIRLPERGTTVYERIDAHPEPAGTSSVIIRSTRVTEDGEPLGESAPHTLRALTAVRVVPCTLGQHVTALLAVHGLAGCAATDLDQDGYAVIRLHNQHRLLPADRPRVLDDVTRVLTRARLFAVRSPSMVIAALTPPEQAGVTAGDLITDRDAAGLIVELGTRLPKR